MELVENAETSEFYPTPESLVAKMLDGVDLDYITTILEPSAGTGNILKAIARKEHSRKFDVDCIEYDSNLRQILKFNFGERKDELYKKKKEIMSKYQYAEKKYGIGYAHYDNNQRKYVPLPEEDTAKLEDIDRELEAFFDNGIHIVHDNFLTYTSYKHYDLIIANPPFSNGDKHLLKMLEIQKHGGSIICLLNAETIKNPCTESRKHLAKLLEEYNAIIEFIPHAFVDAERKTDVEVALIKVQIEMVREESEIFNRMKEAENYTDDYEDVTDIEVTDYIKAAINRFKVEVKSGLELIRQYRALQPYLSNSFEDSIYNGQLLKLINNQDRSYSDVSANEYVEGVRYKYWNALLGNPKFVGKLTSKLQNEYRRKIESLKKYDFTEFNIEMLMKEMNTHIKSGIEEETIEMFDRLTVEHSYYPECKGNIHLFDGWKTNKAHKICKKVIIPCHGVFSDWDGRPRVYEAVSVLEDIERVLNYLDGNMTLEVDLRSTLESNFNQGNTKKIPLKYFEATFYKKGTVHLVFNCPELIDRFNIYAAKHKSWLPPSYGNKTYKNMNEEEKKVIDSFQGQKAYGEVMAKACYYVAPIVGSQRLMLE